MRRVLEAFFRHPFWLLMILVLPPLISVGVAYFVVPHSYEATARMWAYQRYTTITASGVDSNLYATPAQTQAIALTELLNSRSFALSVAKGTDIASTLQLSASALSNPQTLGDDIFADLSKNVVVTPLDYSLYTITYTNTDPQVAQQIVAGVVKQFSTQGIAFTFGQAQRLVQIYQAQLIQAKNQANRAVATEQQYLLAHPELTKPGVSPLNDPQYAALDQQRLQDQYSVQNLQTTISTINEEVNAQGTGAGSFFKELDSPLVPGLPLSRTKKFLVVGGIGAGVGLAACILCILIMVRRDRAIYIPRDMGKLTTVPVVMQLPQLPSATVQLLKESSSW